MGNAYADKTVTVGSKLIDYRLDMRGESPKKAARDATKKPHDKAAKRSRRKAQKKARRFGR